MHTHPSEKPNKNSRSDFIKFSGLAFEMLGFIFLGLFLGYKLDEYLELDQPVFVALFTVLGVVFSIINLIRKLPKN